MKIILSLGNPGARYAETRHNIGWMVGDVVARDLKAEFVPGRGEYYQAVGRWRGEDAAVIKPTTYMNNSGLVARQVVERFDVDPDAILVVVDEVQFPVGRIQLRPSGSDGGHNGLRSIIQHLDTDAFPRLRCGIDRNFAPGEMADYVLSPFAPHETDARDAMIELARQATLVWIAEGTDVAMGRFNKRSAATEENRPAEEDGGENEE